MRVAFVRDWLTVFAGADRVMDAALDLFPDAPIYTLVYQPQHFRRTRIATRPVFTSWVDRLPGGRTWHRLCLPLMPVAVEQFDLSPYDLVVSFSHAVAKGVLTREHQLHICYVFTPIRYGWDLYFASLEAARLNRGPRSWIARGVLHYLRLWDQASAGRPDVLVAASHYVARRIWKVYRRDAQVIYPPVDVDRFHPRRRREEFYLTVSRLVPYKRVDLLVEACSRSRRPLVVIGDGPERRRLQSLAGPTVTLMGEQPDAVVEDHMARCRAFLFAADEDFGIAPVEAQAAGAPVIAYGRGGVTETILPGVTGLFYREQRPESLLDALRAFERGDIRFDAVTIRRQAERFRRERFHRELEAFVGDAWARFTDSVAEPGVRLAQ